MEALFQELFLVFKTPQNIFFCSYTVTFFINPQYLLFLILRKIFTLEKYDVDNVLGRGIMIGVALTQPRVLPKNNLF